MNPSQESVPSPEPAQPSGPPAADPTADPGAYRAPSGPAVPTDPAAEFSAVGPEVYGLAGEGGGYGLAHPSGPEPAPGFAAKWWGMGAVAPRPWKRTTQVTVLSAVVVLVLGGPLGLLWAWIAPSVPVIATGKSIVVDDPSPEQYIAADGWYTLLGLGFGVLVAVIAWLVLRRDRGPFLLLGVVVGTLGAGYLVGPWVGEMIGKSGFDRWQATAVRGATYLAPPEVHSTGPRLVAAFAAAIVLTLLAGWSNDPDLDEPGAKPGYGPNSAADHYATSEGWAEASSPETPDAPAHDAGISGAQTHESAQRDESAQTRESHDAGGPGALDIHAADAPPAHPQSPADPPRT